MQTIELTIDESLLAKLDEITSKLSLTRVAFIQQSLETALQEQEILTQERRHSEGYARHPVQQGEFDRWENVRAWERR